MYGRKDGEWDTVANADDYYTKPQIDTQQNAQDTKIVINNDEIARQQIEITNNSSEMRIWSRWEGQGGKEKLAELPRAIGKSTNK